VLTQRSFPADKHSVTAARRLAAAALADSPSEVRESVELMVSELATNCIRHVNSGFEVTIKQSASTIRVEVSDPSSTAPTIRSPGPDEPTGRGLRIVGMLSSEWGVERRSPRGKTVWFNLSSG
jgi:anti-sigma regulatory factor (Ser/Thr protein kinase)